MHANFRCLFFLIRLFYQHVSLYQEQFSGPSDAPRGTQPGEAQEVIEGRQSYAAQPHRVAHSTSPPLALPPTPPPAPPVAKR